MNLLSTLWALAVTAPVAAFLTTAASQHEFVPSGANSVLPIGVAIGTAMTAMLLVVSVVANRKRKQFHNLSGEYGRSAHPKKINSHTVFTNAVSENVECSIRLGTVLTGADLQGAILDGADLRGVDLSSTKGLTTEQLEVAITDETTRLPKELKTPATTSPKVVS